MWNTVAGYIDEDKPLNEKVKEELKEESGLDFRKIKNMAFGDPYNFYDGAINRTWIIYPVLVEVTSKPKIELDFEHTDFTWIFPDELLNYNTVPSFAKSMRRVLGTS